MKQDEDFPKLYWDEYVNSKTIFMERYVDTRQCITRLSNIRGYLDLHPEFQGLCGMEYSEAKIYDTLRDMGLHTFSARSWGALMAAYMNEKEQQRKYNYCNFYMGVPNA